MGTFLCNTDYLLATDAVGKVGLILTFDFVPSWVGGIRCSRVVVPHSAWSEGICLLLLPSEVIHFDHASTTWLTTSLIHLLACSHEGVSHVG